METLIDKLINIAQSYTGKTPEDFKENHQDGFNWGDMDEKMEIEMRDCARIHESTEKLREIIKAIKDPIIMASCKKELIELNNLLNG